MRANTRILTQHFLSYLALYLFCVVATPAISETNSERASKVTGQDFVRAFLGMCALNAGQYDRIIQIANSLDFEDLPEKMKPLIAPTDPKAEFTGFYAPTGAGAPYFLGLSRGVANGKTMISCAISNPYIETAQVVLALKKIAKIGNPIFEETSMGQRYRVWKTHQQVPNSIISLTDAEPMGYGGATLGITSPPESELK
jgi:hypothetical protein